MKLSKKQRHKAGERQASSAGVGTEAGTSTFGIIAAGIREIKTFSSFGFLRNDNNQPNEKTGRKLKPRTNASVYP